MRGLAGLVVYLSTPMTRLQMTALILSHVSAGCVGIAVGCAVDDRKSVATLSLAVACFCAAGAVVFWFV